MRPAASASLASRPLFMMRSYWKIGLLPAAVMVLFLSTGLDLLAMLLFQVPIAYCWLARREGLAAVLLLSAVAIPSLLAGSLAYGIVFGIMASFGLLLGMLARRRVTIGFTIALVTAGVSGVLVMWSIADWDAVHSDFQITLQEFIKTIESDKTEGAEENIEALRNLFVWVGESLAYLYFGALISGVLLVVTAMTVPIYNCIGVEETLTTANFRFITMRTPEHLVWLAIISAALWFLDSRMPNESVRLLVWNGTILLATVYWINGLSILFFAGHILNWRRIAVYAVLLVMVLFNVVFVLSIFGFFDTWIDFRNKLLSYRNRKAHEDINNSGIE